MNSVAYVLCTGVYSGCRAQGDPSPLQSLKKSVGLEWKKEEGLEKRGEIGKNVTSISPPPPHDWISPPGPWLYTMFMAVSAQFGERPHHGTVRVTNHFCTCHSQVTADRIKQREFNREGQSYSTSANKYYFIWDYKGRSMLL